MQGTKKALPNLGLTMTEDYGDETVMLDDAPHLTKRFSDPCIVVPAVAMLAGRFTVLFDDDFVCLVLKTVGIRGGSEFGPSPVQSSLEPAIEEIRRISVI